MTAAAPALSLGMPVYNGEQYLRDSLESVLGQSFGDFELIICDNGSTDATEDIVRDYASRDPRIRYSRNEKNLGATANYNTVAERATGKYFKWTSSNDICKPGFFEKCVRVLEDDPQVVLCYPCTRLFDGIKGTEEDYDDNLHLMQDDPAERFAAVIDRLRLNNVMNGIARTEAMHKTMLIPDIYCGDQVPIAQLALMGKFFEVPEPLFYRRMDSESATHMKSDEEVLKHFDPEGSRPMLFQRWKLFHLFYRAAADSELSGPDKRRVYRVIMTRARWKRHKLARDIVEATRWRWRSWTS